MTACAIDGCNVTAFARGWCKRHYGRWRRNGDPTIELKGGRPPKVPNEYMAPSAGRLLVTCWCETAYLYVPADIVRAGRTVSCGNSTCKETA